MLKPVTILALDEPSATLASAVQQRVAAACGLEDLVQCRNASTEPPRALIESIHAQRQRPDSSLRTHEDISSRELVLVVVAAAGPARTRVLDVIEEIRRLYEQRRLAEFYTVELLCLLPDLFAGAKPEDYGAAYALLKVLSDARACDAVWLLDSMNANRVKFGDVANSAYADAIAGALTYEPELSGALSGAFRPRGMDATFSSFGYAELVFPRDAALQRLEPRFANELISRVLLRRADNEGSLVLRAKQFIVDERFALPLSRIGLDAGQSLFKRFPAKTLVNDKTRNADELIAAVRAELKSHRDTTHLGNLTTLSKQSEQTSAGSIALVDAIVDETLDGNGYTSAIAFLAALLDPLPDLHPDGTGARNLVTEIQAATAALDARLHFIPNHTNSDAARKRVRELETLIEDQKLVADTIAPESAAEQLETMTKERDVLLAQLPELVFAEESANNQARNAAREAESTRLAEETLAREQNLRELFEARPRAEHALAEAREMRRKWLWKQTLWAALAVVAVLAWTRDVRYAGIVLALFAIGAGFRYVTAIAPLVRAAREHLQRLVEQIDAADKAKNTAHNDELQFDYDMALRRATLSVLRRTRESARQTLDGLRARVAELEELARSFAPASISASGMSIAIISDDDVDAWYERTTDDRKPLVREFPITRAQSRHLALDVLRAQLQGYAANAFGSFRAFTMAQAVTLVPEASLAQRLKRFADYAAPLIELRDDLEAEKSMQSDTTLWIDANDRALLSVVTRRLPDANHKPATDPLRIHAVARTLHYPAYILGQIDYYRAQYDASRFPESTNAPDLLPTELALTGTLRTAYEQVLLGRALGVIELRADGQLASGATVLGNSHLAAAEHLSPAIRESIAVALEPRLPVIASDLQRFAEMPSLSALDRGIVGALVKRYGIA